MNKNIAIRNKIGEIPVYDDTNVQKFYRIIYILCSCKKSNRYGQCSYYIFCEDYFTSKKYIIYIYYIYIEVVLYDDFEKDNKIYEFLIRDSENYESIVYVPKTENQIFIPEYSEIFSEGNIATSAKSGGECFIYEASKPNNIYHIYYDDEEDYLKIEYKHFNSVKNKNVIENILDVFLGRPKLAEKN